MPISDNFVFLCLFLISLIFVDEHNGVTVVLISKKYNLKEHIKGQESCLIFLQHGNETISPTELHVSAGNQNTTSVPALPQVSRKQLSF